MKSYTDFEQSKKLSKILPLESADMRYGHIAPYDYSDRMYDGGYDEVPYPKDFLKKNSNFSEDEYDGSLPCWSLTALMELTPNDVSLLHFEDAYQAVYDIRPYHITPKFDNPLDATFEMICWLKENEKL